MQILSSNKAIARENIKYCVGVSHYLDMLSRFLKFKMNFGVSACEFCNCFYA